MLAARPGSIATPSARARKAEPLLAIVATMSRRKVAPVSASPRASAARSAIWVRGDIPLSTLSEKEEPMMRFITNIRSLAWVAAQVRAKTTLFMLWAALGGVALPGLAGADGSCVDVTSEAVRDRTDVRAAVECANGFAPVTGRSQAKVSARVPDPPPAIGSTWTNTLGAEFKWIPAGKFIMGSPADEAG